MFNFIRNLYDDPMATTSKILYQTKAQKNSHGLYEYRIVSGKNFGTIFKPAQELVDVSGKVPYVCYVGFTKHGNIRLGTVNGTIIELNDTYVIYEKPADGNTSYVSLSLNTDSAATDDDYITVSKFGCFYKSDYEIMKNLGIKYFYGETMPTSIS